MPRLIGACRNALPTLWAAPVVALVALAIVATCASAGTYTVYSCRTPAGGAASLDGWHGDASTGAKATTTNGCPSGPLQLKLSHDTPHPVGEFANTTFYAPAD